MPLPDRNRQRAALPRLAIRGNSDSRRSIPRNGSYRLPRTLRQRNPARIEADLRRGAGVEWRRVGYLRGVFGPGGKERCVTYFICHFRVGAWLRSVGWVELFAKPNRHQHLGFAKRGWARIHGRSKAEENLSSQSTFSSQNILQSTYHRCREEKVIYLFRNSANSCPASKSSTHPTVYLDCFASLAMTGRGRRKKLAPLRGALAPKQSRLPA
jgi:hypothetical protein